MNGVSGATSAGFRTTVHPAAIAAPALEMTERSGAFQAVMAPTTPEGTRCSLVLPNCSNHSISPRNSAMRSSSSTAPATWDRLAAVIG